MKPLRIEKMSGRCLHQRHRPEQLLKTLFTPVAGKTGTALVANGNRGYADHIYQSSFAGYFPADHPQYTCIVVIRNKPFAKKYLGAQVAGPVFREVADKLMSLEALSPDPVQLTSYTLMLKKDSCRILLCRRHGGNKKCYATTCKCLMRILPGIKNGPAVFREKDQPVIKAKNVDAKQVPDVKGMGLKDALYLLESREYTGSYPRNGKSKTTKYSTRHNRCQKIKN